ncbi:hypothetical protein ALC56_01963 [Trachymyrmex septentrionalis]|uniref:Uncharacterized protein n=1 Tax=Trachymyrmex septentrionalis TaxID=34720 RepID=A0A195FTF3_9HYME|nr:hypothetical protein ALC56_01963 [Trachymyrmex septentrionalis]
MFNIFHKIFYFRSGTLQTAGNLQVFQSTAGRGKSESKGRIEGSYTSMARRMGVFVVTKHPATPDRREIQSRKKESVGIRKGKGRNDGVRLGERRCVDWVSRRLENGPRLVPPSETFSPKFLDLLNLNVNRAFLDNLLQQLTRLEVSAPVCDTFLEDVKVPLALNYIANVLLVKCEEMTRNIESGVKGYGYAAIQTDRRIKDAVEIAEGDAALRLVVDEEA